MSGSGGMTMPTYVFSQPHVNVWWLTRAKSVSHLVQIATASSKAKHLKMQSQNHPQTRRILST